MAFGAQVAQFAASTQLLINISNDAWFGRTIGLWQNLEMARMRAMETGRPVLRATNTGLTAVIGADGQVRKRISPFLPGVLVENVVPRAGKTPYVRWRGAWVL
ncbi:MAG: nitrilase-related carbon-nitrogen hydrolase [Marinobacter sp.]